MRRLLQVGVLGVPEILKIGGSRLISSNGRSLLVVCISLSSILFVRFLHHHLLIRRCLMTICWLLHVMVVGWNHSRIVELWLLGCGLLRQHTWVEMGVLLL